MKIRDLRSISIISVYVLLNVFILVMSFSNPEETVATPGAVASLAPDFTLIEDLDYFHLKEAIPQMSLSAEQMKSQGEETAEFQAPKGVYNYQKKDETIRYQGNWGKYEKQSETLVLKGDVKMTSTDSEYYADTVKYFFNQDLMVGKGGVKFIGEDLKSKDQVTIEAATMRAHPDQKLGKFKGGVKGSMTRKKKYEGKMDFRSDSLHLNGITSLAHLEGDVWLKRGGQIVTAGKADIYLENFNKSLKYFVLNDDVKVTEKLETPNGITQRKAFAERLEGFGREQKMVLSGAPRVEQGSDVIKGYRITIRENVDLLEVDDAMSDVKVKREEKKKN